MWQGPIWFNIARLVLYIIIPGIQQGITTRWFLNILSCANNCCLSLLGFGTGKWRVTRLEPSAAVGALTVLDVAALAFNREWVKSRFVVKVSLLFFCSFLSILVVFDDYMIYPILQFTRFSGRFLAWYRCVQRFFLQQNIKNEESRIQPPDTCSTVNHVTFRLGLLDRICSLKKTDLAERASYTRVF